MTNAVTGAVTHAPHRYVEIASGLNYLDPATGQYQPSQDLIELTADGGAAAVHGPAKLYVKPNLNTAGAITLVTASNRVFQTRPLGVFWYNAQSGQAQLLAPVRDCVGELVPPNQVVFKSAFGPLADLRLVYTKSGIESDLVLLQAPTPPAGWDPQTTRLELWHDWTGSPAPRLTSRVLYRETNAVVRSQMLEPDLTDEILDFGDLWFPTGAAYATDGSDAPPANTARQVRVPNLGRDPGLVAVAKTWLDTPQMTVLVEGVRWADIQPKVQALPPAAPSFLPALPQDRLAWLNQLPAPHAFPQAGQAITLAAADYHPAGLVLDYQTVPSSWWGNYSFDGGTTYYVSSSTYFGGGTVTFQPGCVIKFSGGYLLMYGSIVCNGTSQNPSVLTAWNDDLFGEKLPISQGCPSYQANPAVWDYYIPGNVTISGMRIRWAHTAIEFDGSGDPYCNGYPDCCGQLNTVSGCSLEFCETGVRVMRCAANLVNSTMCGVVNPTASQWTCQWCSVFYGSLSEILPTVSGLSDVSRLAGSEGEPAIAVNPANPLNLFVAYPHCSDCRYSSGFQVYAARSVDAGATWSSSSLPDSTCDPSVAFDAFGNLFVSYIPSLGVSNVVVLISTDGGASFSTQTVFSDGGALLDQPTITTGPGGSVAPSSVWITFSDDAPSARDVVASGAPVTGLGQVGAWTALQHIQNSTCYDSQGQHPQPYVWGDIAVGPDGQVSVVFQSASPEQYLGPSDIRMSVNPYGLGQNAFASAWSILTSSVGFAQPIPAQPGRTIDVEAGFAWDRSCGPHRGRLYMVYTDRPASDMNNTDIYVMHSDNNGSTWSNPLKINTDSTTTSQFLPRIALDQTSGNVAVSWYDCRADTAYNRKTQFYAAVSSDGGETFSANILLEPGQSDRSLVSPELGCQSWDYWDYSGLAYHGGYFYPAWADNSNATGGNPDGTLQMDIYVAKVRY